MTRVRTTLSLDQDVHAYARQVAAETGRPLGEVVSELARAAMNKGAGTAIRNGIILLPAGPRAKSATLEDVNRIRDDLP